MSEDLDPSPRQSKRRRTYSYATDRSHVSSAEKPGQLSADRGSGRKTPRRVSSRLNAATTPKNDVDSAYGSKEDSLAEDDVQGTGAGASHPPVAKRIAILQSAESLEIPETPENVTAKATTSSTRRIPRSAAPTAKSSSTRSAAGSKRKTSTNRSAAGNKKLELRQSHSEGPQSANKESSAVVEPEVEESQDELQLEDGTTPTRAGSVRSRRRPRRYSVESQSTREPSPILTNSRAATTSVAASPQPRGILTPSKGLRNGQRKSVVFGSNDKQIEEDLGFKDIDKSVKKARRGARATKPVTNLAKEDTFEDDETIAPATAAVDDDPLLDFDQPVDILGSLDPVDATSSDAWPDDTPAVQAIKAKVLARLTSAEPMPPAPHLASQQSALSTLLTSTVVSGESNSLLLLGPRGAGKTLVLENVLSALTAQHSDLFHTVRLNGFFQTDDRVALREIWRQLGRETQDDDAEQDATAPISYADTLASLLSLLSHPDEMDVGMEDGPDVDPDAPAKMAKSTIIVLDEFDLFTLHPRQTLLYNLFDIAQSRKAPIAVIGCSTRMDAVESLEKRVKSRFSHRWLHVPPVRTLAEMNDVVKTAVTVPEELEDNDLAETDRHLYAKEAAKWNEHVKVSRNFNSTLSSSTDLIRLHSWSPNQSHISYLRRSTQRSPSPWSSPRSTLPSPPSPYRPRHQTSQLQSLYPLTNPSSRRFRPTSPIFQASTSPFWPPSAQPPTHRPSLPSPSHTPTTSTS